MGWEVVGERERECVCVCVVGWEVEVGGLGTGDAGIGQKERVLISRQGGL